MMRYAYIKQELSAVVPICEESTFLDTDRVGGDMKWMCSFPLRLARAVTILREFPRNRLMQIMKKLQK